VNEMNAQIKGNIDELEALKVSLGELQDHILKVEETCRSPETFLYGTRAGRYCLGILSEKRQQIGMMILDVNQGIAAELLKDYEASKISGTKCE